MAGWFIPRFLEAKLLWNSLSEHHDYLIAPRCRVIVPDIPLPPGPP